MSVANEGASSERRGNVRLNRVLAIGVEREEGKLSSTVAVDLSVSGCQVAADFPLEREQVFALRLHLRSRRPVEATARVVWCDGIEMGLYRIGFRFEEMRSQEDFERLLQFVEKERLNVDGLPAEHDPALELASQVTLRSLTDNELERFAVLGRISELLNGSYDLQVLLDRTLRITVEATGAERGIILLARGDSDFETPAFHAVSDTQNRAFSRSVVDQVSAGGQPLLSLDAQTDERLLASNSIRVMGTRSVLCLPIATRARKFGLIYLDSSVRAGILTQSDLRLGTVIAGMAASAMERAENFAMMVQREKMALIGTLTAGFLHEIGNPLASIMGIGELLQMEMPGQLTDDLMAEARRCQRLIQDLLRLSRQEPVAFSRLQLGPVIAMAVTAVKAKLDQHKVQLSVESTEDLPEILGHADHLRQVVLNLLANAAFAAGQSASGKVWLALSMGSGEVMITVSDNGLGVASEHLPRLFDPFFTTKDPEEGTGLGLSIIARIVAEHGGRVQAGNRPEGGAVFTVSLPCAQASPGTAAVSL